ncbi:MAG: 50S ribosomal protein L6 [Pseudomonadales bacterium]|nr:50S ribosomal protein L6 [Pseudomonadales bacterium]
MSRVAKNPVVLPKGVEVTLSGNTVVVKGSKGSLEMTVHDSVRVEQQDNLLTFAPRNAEASADALAGTTRVLVGNMVAGVSNGFERRLQLIGVGYRAAAKGETLGLTLGFSHPVEYALPKGVTAETPTQTEIVLKSADKQLLGRVAAEIRAFRPPEPYKGKGVRYSNENVIRKEAKKK